MRNVCSYLFFYIHVFYVNYSICNLLYRLTWEYKEKPASFYTYICKVSGFDRRKQEYGVFFTRKLIINL